MKAISSLGVVRNPWLELPKVSQDATGGNPWLDSSIFGCSIDVAQQKMALNFKLVVSNQLFSVVLAVSSDSK